MKLHALKDKKILVLGFGKEGEDTFLFLRKIFPEKTIGIADVKYKIQNTRYKIQNVKWHLGKNYLDALKDYDVIIKSPGIPFKTLRRTVLRKVITQTDIFFDNCPGKIIGITGTKGKSTTSSLIYKILKTGGLTVKLVGNIGKPVLSFLNIGQPVLGFLVNAKADEIFVYELSSHQLYNLKTSPHIAVFLNLFREHLDYYKNFKEYARAKANIVLHQSKNDFLVFNAADKIVSEFTKKSKAKKIPITGEYFNLDKNAAKAVGLIFKIPESIIDKAIEKFKPLPHRMELVGTFKGITFYNDALATIPEATMAAIDFLGDKVETIMLGGFDRKINFQKLAKKIIESKIKTVILFPTTGTKIWNEIKKSGGEGQIKHFFVNDMAGAVKLAFQYTGKGKICLLSTASSSFSIFKDYKEKGNLFKNFVRNFIR